MSQHADVTETHMKCEFMFHLLGVGGLPSWLSGEEASYQCRRLRKCRFDPWVRKTPWRKKWQPTPVLLGNPMDRGAWRATAHGVAKSWTRLSTQANTGTVLQAAVQSLCRARLFVTPWTTARQASLSFTRSRSLLKLMSIESVMPSNHLVLCHPPLLLPSIFPSIRVFSNELALRIRWPKCWSFSLNICASREYSGLTSFKIGWFDLLAVQVLHGL